MEGATLSGLLNAKGAKLVRICGASFSGPVKVVGSTGSTGSTGSVAIGAGEGCASSVFHGTVTVKQNTVGVQMVQNAFHASLKAQGNGGGATVTANTIAGALTVTGNTGTVTDTPNEVEGKSKLQ